MDRTEAARLLGVEAGATPDAVRAAYRRRARALHPDAGGGDPVRMAELNLAYRVFRRPAEPTAPTAPTVPTDCADRADDAGHDRSAEPDPRLDADVGDGDGRSGGLMPRAVLLAIFVALIITVMFVFAVGFDASVGSIVLGLLVVRDVVAGQPIS